MKASLRKYNQIVIIKMGIWLGSKTKIAKVGNQLAKVLKLLIHQFIILMLHLNYRFLHILFVLIQLLNSNIKRIRRRRIILMENLNFILMIIIYWLIQVQLIMDGRYILIMLLIQVCIHYIGFIPNGMNKECLMKCRLRLNTLR
jgi:hypothetical protein